MLSLSTDELSEWTESNNILGWEQIGFRRGGSAFNQSLILFHLAAQHASFSEAVLYVAFMDLKGAFNSISRLRL